MNTIQKKIVGSEILQALASFSVVMLARVGGNLATLAYTLIFVRLLTPAEFGAVSSLWSLAQLLVPLATLNLAPVAIRAVVRARQNGADDLAAGFIAFSRQAIAIAAPCTMALYLAIVWIKFPEYLHTSLAGVLLVTLMIAGMARVQTGAAIGVALDKAAASQVPRELVRPLMLLVMLLVVAALGLKLTVSSALVLYAITVIANMALQHYLLRDAMAFTKAQPPRIENPKAWLTTGLYLLPSRMINDNAKILMIVVASTVLSLEQVALITVALSLSGLLGFAISAVEISFSAKLSRALHARQEQRTTKLLAVGGATKLVLCAIMVLAVLFALKPLLAAFGKHYTSADGITLTLMAIPLIKALFGKADLVLLVHDMRKPIFWVQLMTLVLLPVSALLTLVLPTFDPAMVTSIGFVFAFFVGYAGLWWVSLNRTGIDTSAPGAMIKLLRTRTST